MIQAGSAYNQKYAYLRCERTQQIMNKFSTIRFNRYGGGQIMRQHHDHIHSLFDGNEKGIPCLLYTSPSPRDLSTSRMPSSA